MSRNKKGNMIAANIIGGTCTIVANNIWGLGVAFLVGIVTTQLVIIALNTTYPE